MKLRILGLLLMACVAAAAADRDFERVVKAIETHYGTSHTHIPLMGVANFVVKVARPAGTSSFHIAVFENLNAPGEERDDFMDRVDTGKLHPLVRVHSNHDGAATYILAADAGKTTRLLIAAFTRHEATVIEVRVNADALRRVVEHPDATGKAYMGRHDDR